VDEKEVPPQLVTDRLGLERFQEVGGKPTFTPWQWCWTVPFKRAGGGQISREQSVAFCVAFRKTLISCFDGDAPPLLTGRYSEGALVPANRLAIQIVSASPLLRHELPTAQAFVLAIPRGADPADIEVIGKALNLSRSIHTRHGKAVLRVSPGESRALDAQMTPADEFWDNPPRHLRRVWSVLPTAVDTRRQGKNWTLTDAIVLSIGLVWKDDLAVPGLDKLRGEQRYREIVKAARARGVRVLDARALPTSQVDKYVHKVPPGLLPLPYVGTVRLGDLDPSESAFLAIGQSRHLGGGMLVPSDVTEDVLGALESHR
jgi:CRISPR-associated protein Csb2